MDSSKKCSPDDCIEFCLFYELSGKNAIAQLSYAERKMKTKVL